MEITERDVVMTGRDENGQPTMDFPVTRLGNIENDAEIKTTPGEGDYIPITDSTPGGRMKKLPASALQQALKGAEGQILGFDKNGRPVPQAPPKAEDMDAVPVTRKINGKGLDKDIDLSAGDVGARPDDWMPSAEEVGARPDDWMPSPEEMDAAPTADPVFTGSISLGRKAETNVGDASTAEGENVTASGKAAHAEGSETVASGSQGHAEGLSAIAAGGQSHAEGWASLAAAGGCHVEGVKNIAAAPEQILKIKSCDITAKKFVFDDSFYCGYNSSGENNSFASTFARLEIGSKIYVMVLAVSQPCGSFTVNTVSADDHSVTVQEDIPSGNYVGAVAVNYTFIPNSANSGHAEGLRTISARSAHAEGTLTSAFGVSSHAEGDGNTADGAYSHAEGRYNKATGDLSHVEGGLTEASGPGAHSEGAETEAPGFAAHAEGEKAVASGRAAHAEGVETLASGKAAHAAGIWTTADNECSMAIGMYNKPMSKDGVTTGENSGILSPTVALGVAGDVFVIGNGYKMGASPPSNAFRVTFGGDVYATKAYLSTGADYAEFFEWQDGNPEVEDRVGRFVTLDGEKIRLAQPEDDFILGIVSGQPCIIGNGDEDWQGRWQRDIFGRMLTETVEVPEIKSEIVQPEGEDEKPEIRSVPTGETIRVRRFIANPDYDPAQPYVERKYRQEWDCVGMLGVLVICDDGTCQINGWCTSGEDGIATASMEKTKFRVMARLDESHVRVLILR